MALGARTHCESRQIPAPQQRLRGEAVTRRIEVSAVAGGDQVGKSAHETGPERATLERPLDRESCGTKSTNWIRGGGHRKMSQGYRREGPRMERGKGDGARSMLKMRVDWNEVRLCVNDTGIRQDQGNRSAVDTEGEIMYMIGCLPAAR